MAESSSRSLSINEMRDAAEQAVTIAAAVEAGIFEGLAADAAGADELADRLELDRRGVAILLPLLAELDLLEARGDGRWALTSVGTRRFADPSSPEYTAGGMPLWLENMRAWTELPEVLRTGEPIVRAADEEPDREAIARFMAGMAAAPEARVRRIVDICLARNPDARTALDLGGGPGHYSRALVDAGLEVTMMDTPETIDYVAEAYGLADTPGLQLHGGDFMEDPLPDGPYDIVLLSNILHSYPPDRNRALLRRTAHATAPGGAAGILEFMRGRSARATRFAVIMLLRTEGGDTYTERQYAEWLRDAGFRSTEVEDIDADRQLMTGVRADG